jgi:hyperosmotically inducible periplasmic protein
MSKFLIIGLMLASAVQFGCSADNNRPAEAAGEAALTDTQLEERIESAIHANTGLNDIDADANAKDNLVTLSGTVETEAQRTTAVQLARDTHPGLVVTDKIDVKPRELTRAEYTEEHAKGARETAAKFGDKIGDSLDDAWIHTKITTKLLADRDASAHEVNVDVNNNVVTLRGTVDTAEEKAEAERIAKETEGVKSVRNQLKVAPKSATR